jgi:hypothetical protein
MYGIRSRSSSPNRYQPLNSSLPVDTDDNKELDDNKDSDYSLSTNSEKYVPLLDKNIKNDNLSGLSARRIVHNNLSCFDSIRELSSDEYNVLANCFELLWDNSAGFSDLDKLFRITYKVPTSYETVPRVEKVVSIMLGVAAIVVALEIISNALHYSFSLNNAEIFAGINAVCILLILFSLALLQKYVKPNLLGGANDVQNKNLIRKTTLSVFKSISQELLKNKLDKPELLDQLEDLLNSL